MMTEATMSSKTSEARSMALRILFCSPCELKPTLGAAKVLLELSDELTQLGCECTLVDFKILGVSQAEYPDKLETYIRENAAKFDVIDFDYGIFKLERREYPDDTLFVARSQLMTHHLLRYFPSGDSLKARLGHFKRTMRWRSEVRRLDHTFSEADFVSVLNHDDKSVLQESGIDPRKIRVFPNSLSQELRTALEAIPASVPDQPLLTTIGMFGPRKGSLDFNAIALKVIAAHPDARFRFLGTRGMFRTAEEVLAHFDPSIRDSIEVIPSYQPSDLDELLSESSLGVFPSYAEGFPLSIIEMMTAAIPVVAYHSPGPPEILDDSMLVPQGDWSAMANRLIHLLDNKEELLACKERARSRTREFTWSAIAQRTLDEYTQAHQQLKVAAE